MNNLSPIKAKDTPLTRVGTQKLTTLPKLNLQSLSQIQKEQEQEELQRRRDMQDAEINAQKGISKSFVKYKQSLKNPTDEELKFHEFVHTAVKRREERRTQMLKQRKEEAMLAERQRKHSKEK